MKKDLLIATCGIVAALVAEAAPTIVGTGAPAAMNGCSKLRFDYKLTEEPAVVTVDIQQKVGGEWTSIGGEHQQNLIGAVNRRIAPSADLVRSIYWNGELDWPGHHVDAGNFRAVIEAWPTNALPDYMVVDPFHGDNVWFYRDKASIPGGITNRLYKTDYFVFRKIPAKGVIWQMGDGSSTYDDLMRPKHSVTLTEDYYMACYETTHKQYQWIRSISGSETGCSSSVARSKDNGEIADGNDIDLCPVGWVNTIDLRCNPGDPAANDWSPSNPSHAVNGNSVLGKFRAMAPKLKLIYDLPTEAQWEYACRAGTATAYNVGDSLEVNGVWQGWTKDNPQCGEKKHEVGLLMPNNWDLYDMHGNVSEICLDYAMRDLGTASVTDPVGGTSSSGNRVNRGGNYSWSPDLKYSASSARYRAGAGSGARYSSIGFRLCAPAIIQ